MAQSLRTAITTLKTRQPSTARLEDVLALEVVNSTGRRTVQSFAAWSAANPVLAAGAEGFESDTGVMRVGNGTSAFLALSSGMRSTKMTGNAIVNSTVVNADIPGLAFTVQANHLYKLEWFISYQSIITTTGISFFCSTPTLNDGDHWTWDIQSAASGTDQFYQQTTGVYGSTVTSAAVVTADTPYLAKSVGFFTPSADGTIQLKFKSEVDTSAVTVNAGGCGFITDCG